MKNPYMMMVMMIRMMLVHINWHIVGFHSRSSTEKIKNFEFWKITHTQNAEKEISTAKNGIASMLQVAADKCSTFKQQPFR